MEPEEGSGSEIRRAERIRQKKKTSERPARNSGVVGPRRPQVNNLTKNNTHDGDIHRARLGKKNQRPEDIGHDLDIGIWVAR